MRFLTTCLLLFCFQSFVVCTVEDGSLTFVQEQVAQEKSTKISPLHIKTSALNEVIGARVKFSTIDQQRIIHQFNLIFEDKDDAFIYQNCIIQSLANYSRYRFKISTFILDYLYSKHTFW